MSEYKKAVLLVVAAGFFLSTLGIGTRLMDNASGLQIVFYRALGVAIASTIFLLVQRRRGFFVAFVESGKPMLYASVFLSGASIFIVLAVVNTTVANAMFIISMAPLIAGLFAWALLGERIARKTWVAMVAAVIGVLIIINGALSSEGLVGIGYAFLMLLCYGSFVVSLRFGRNVNMVPALCLSSYVLLAVLGLSVDDLSISIKDIAICLALGVFQVGLGTYLLILGSAHVPAAQLTLLAMLEVVLNPLWVWLGVGEVPAASTLLGGGVILLAITYEALSSPPKSDEVEERSPVN